MGECGPEDCLWTLRGYSYAGGQLCHMINQMEKDSAIKEFEVHGYYFLES